MTLFTPDSLLHTHPLQARMRLSPPRSPLYWIPSLSSPPAAEDTSQLQPNPPKQTYCPKPHGRMFAFSPRTSALCHRIASARRLPPTNPLPPSLPRSCTLADEAGRDGGWQSDRGPAGQSSPDRPAHQPKGKGGWALWGSVTITAVMHAGWVDVLYRLGQKLVSPRRRAAARHMSAVDGAISVWYAGHGPGLPASASEAILTPAMAFGPACLLPVSQARHTGEVRGWT